MKDRDFGIIVIIMVISIIILIFPDDSDSVGRVFEGPYCTYQYSDTEHSIYVRGRSLFYSCVTVNFTDSCLGPCTLLEFDKGSSMNVDCQYGCKDDACLRSPSLDSRLSLFCAYTK